MRGLRFAPLALLLHWAGAAPAPAVSRSEPRPSAAPAQLFADRAPVEGFQDPDRLGKIRAALPKLETYLAGQLASQKVPGFVFGVIADRELVYEKGFGV